MFFEIDEAERVIFESRRDASYVLREDIELCNAWGPQTKEPDLRLELSSFACWGKTRRATEDGGRRLVGHTFDIRDQEQWRCGASR